MEGKGGTWEAFRESLERSGYFEGLLPGSQEYRRLMQNAEEYFMSSSLFSRTRSIFKLCMNLMDRVLLLWNFSILEHCRLQI